MANINKLVEAIQQAQANEHQSLTARIAHNMETSSKLSQLKGQIVQARQDYFKLKGLNSEWYKHSQLHGVIATNTYEELNRKTDEALANWNNLKAEVERLKHPIPAIPPEAV